MNILVTVEGQKMRIATDQQRHIEGSKRFVRFRFDLSEEWHDMIIFANFVQGDKLYPVQLDSSACAYLPSEVREGNCLLVLYGGTSGKQTSEDDAGSVIKATTEPLFLDIGKDITAQKVPELVTDTDQSNYERMLKELKEGILANKVFNDAITDAVNSLNDSAVAQEIIENKNAVTTMRNELLGDGGTNSSPGSNSTLDRINKSYNEIIGSGRTYENPSDASALKEIRTAKNEIVGSENNALSPAPESALGQIKKSYSEIFGKDGSFSSPASNTALKEIRNAKEAIVGGEDANTALSPSSSSALGQINKTYNEILGKSETNSYSNPASNTALKEIRDAKNEIVGYGNASTASSPTDTSALGQVKKIFKEMVGDIKSNSYDNPTDNTVLKEIRDTKKELIGTSGTASTPDADSTLSRINNSYSEIIGSSGSYKNPSDNTALKEIRKSTTEIVGVNGSALNPISGSALDQIRNSHNQILGEKGKADSPIKGSALEQTLSAKDSTINAHDTIVGKDGSVTSPTEGSALSEARKSETEAKNAAERAKGYAEVANHGINVVDDLLSDSGSDALSAKQGKLLDNKKLNLIGGTMTGPLTLNGDPSEDNMAATKKYVDEHLPPKADNANDGLMSKEDYGKLSNISTTASVINGSDSLITSGAVYAQLSGLKFVVANQAPTDTDESTITIVLAN